VKSTFLQKYTKNAIGDQNPSGHAQNKTRIVWGKFSVCAPKWDWVLRPGVHVCTFSVTVWEKSAFLRILCTGTGLTFLI
jgi:hypothetical protein